MSRWASQTRFLDRRMLVSHSFPDKRRYLRPPWMIQRWERAALSCPCCSCSEWSSASCAPDLSTLMSFLSLGMVRELL
ncbi:hypothetical protein BV20DRAFT_102844 [Pilatotrama ljubarskyi]|nr:hypothetical protein BV20DRAFT_102844 [Pilatotrama ljubarskyi]